MEAKEPTRAACKPRITISIDLNEDVLNIALNSAGRDLLVSELLRLSEIRDHVHLGTPDNYGEIVLSPVAYRGMDRIVERAKILLRPDDWDRKYFPHVILDE